MKLPEIDLHVSAHFHLSRPRWTLSRTQLGVSLHQGVAEGCCDFGKPLYNPGVSNGPIRFQIT